MKLENYMYLVPVAAVIALIFAAYLARMADSLQELKE